MKNKFSLIGRGALALVMVLSLSLVTAVPASAEITTDITGDGLKTFSPDAVSFGENTFTLTAYDEHFFDDTSATTFPVVVSLPLIGGNAAFVVTATSVALSGGSPDSASVLLTDLDVLGNPTTVKVRLDGDGTPGEVDTITLTITADSPAVEGVYTWTVDTVDLAGDTNPTDTVLVTVNARPTFVSATATSDTNIDIVFSEDITINDSPTPTWATAITAGGGLNATAGTASGSILSVTVDPLSATDYTAADLAIALDTVEDIDGMKNAGVTGETIDDGQKPTFTAATATTETILVTFTEDVDSTLDSTGPWSVAGNTVSAGYRAWWGGYLDHHPGHRHSH